MIKVLHRWCPTRQVVIVADSQFAALEWLDACRPHASVVTRLRLDAALYDPAPPRDPHTKGRPRVKGQRLPALAKIAADPQMVWTSLVVPRW